jgi:tight adherence protein C
VDLLPELLGGVGALASGLGAAWAFLAASRGYLQLKRHSFGKPEGGEDAARGAGLPAWLRRTIVAFLAALNARVLPTRLRERLEVLLGRAGHPGELMAAEVAALSELGGCALMPLGLALWLCFDLSPLVLPAAVVLGASYPLLWLRDKAQARAQAIVRALPYNLDLLTLSVEAGLDFAAAIGKVVEKGRRGPLADELSLLLRELRLGKTREEALRNLAARVGIASVSSLVSALMQADRMGTPLGKVLRILATQLRVERTQRAEKLANEAPVKMLFPLVCFIFPTVFLMLFGPIAYQVFVGE